MWLTAATLLAALALGGQTWRTSEADIALQLVCLPLLGCAIWRLPRRRFTGYARAACAIAVAMIALPVLQLIVLPAEIWTELPGRAVVERGFTSIDAPLPPLPISLEPSITRGVALSLLPALAVFLSVLSLDFHARRRLVFLVIGFAFVSILIGLAQIQSGADEVVALRATGHSAVGLFANRNHLAALLYGAMPLTAACAVGWMLDRPQSGRRGAALFTLIYACLLLGDAMTRSRAGLALGCAATVACLALAWSSSRRAGGVGPRGMLIGGAIAGFILVANFALLGVMQRLESEVSDDYRFTIYHYGVRAMADFFPAGAGFGSFAAVYEMYEPVSAIRSVYANNAHNDWLELLIEGGAPAAAIAVAFVVWLTVGAAQSWSRRMRRGSALDAALQRAATILLALLLLHSIVDYPLRSTALMTLFALASGLLVHPLEGRRVATPEDSKRRRSGRPHSARHSAGGDNDHASGERAAPSASPAG